MKAIGNLAREILELKGPGFILAQSIFQLSLKRGIIGVFIAQPLTQHLVVQLEMMPLLGDFLKLSDLGLELFDSSALVVGHPGHLLGVGSCSM